MENYTDIKKIYELKLVHVQSREILRRMCQAIRAATDRNPLEIAMAAAADHGNVELITGFAKANPELVWSFDIARLVIERGIKNRHPKIFSLIYGIRNKVAVLSIFDHNENNMLHKAAVIAAPRTLSRIPGAALQMQRELQWFKVH